MQQCKMQVFMRKIRTVQMKIFIYCIIFFDVIMKKTVSPISISHWFLPVKNHGALNNFKNV